MAPDETPKFCKDCALFAAPGTCNRPHPVPFNLVTGEALAPRLADSERRWPSAITDSCGSEAKFWTAKP